MATAVHTIEVETEALRAAYLFYHSALSLFEKGQKGAAVTQMEKVQRIVRENRLKSLYGVRLFPPSFGYQPSVIENKVRSEPMGGSFTKITFERLGKSRDLKWK